MKSGSFFKGRPLNISLIIAAMIIAVLCVSLVSCSDADRSSVNGSGILLDDSCWITDTNGYKSYQKHGFSSSAGIDVSEFVQDIDFKQVRKAGIDFVILRVGYRGYDLGGLIADNNLGRYLRDASAAGLQIGVYFVSQAISTEEAVEEAEFVMDKIRGYHLTMPIYIDLEDVPDTARTDHLTVEEITDIADTFCRTVEENGYRGGVYANETWFRDRLNFQKIRKYDIWLAKYADTPAVSYPINMWQYTYEGDVPGTSQYVDLNARISLELPDDE